MGVELHRGERDNACDRVFQLFLGCRFIGVALGDHQLVANVPQSLHRFLVGPLACFRRLKVKPLKHLERRDIHRRIHKPRRNIAVLGVNLDRALVLQLPQIPSNQLCRVRQYSLGRISL